MTIYSDDVGGSPRHYPAMRYDRHFEAICRLNQVSPLHQRYSRHQYLRLYSCFLRAPELRALHSVAKSILSVSWVLEAAGR